MHLSRKLDFLSMRLYASRAFSSAAYFSLFPYLLSILNIDFGLDLSISGIVVALVLVAAVTLDGTLRIAHGPLPYRH